MPKRFQLGIYNPDPDIPEVTLLGSTREGSASEIEMMLETMREYNEWAAGELDVFQCIGIFAVKRSRVTAWHPA